MRKRLFRRKPFVVDDQQYEASLTATYDDVVHLRATIRANFGNRSFCTFNGLRSFDYYYNYGHWNETDSIAITPRLIAALIRFARREGWTPEASKSNQQIKITNMDARSILDAYNELADSAVPKGSDSHVGNAENTTSKPMKPGRGPGVS